MRKSLRASMLVLVLALSTHAGEIPNPPINPPGAPAQTTVAGDMHYPIVDFVLTLLTLL